MTFAAQTPPRPPVDSDWIEAELVRSFMRAVTATQAVTALLMGVTAAMLWGAVSDAWLLVWLVAAVLVSLLRAVVLHRFNERLAGGEPAVQLAYFRRTAWVWPLSAVLWGGLTWLFFDTAPLTTQFIAWLILGGVAMFAVNSLAPRLEVVRQFINVLVLVMLGVTVWRVVVDLQLQGPYYHYWLMALIVIFWQVLQQTARRLHGTHRRHFELQFRNNQLIASLTRQTQAALEAVEIKNRFLASATHDIRQPVHALGLYADWLASEPELVNELAPKIVDATKAINALFDRLFDMARLDAGAVHLQIGEVPLDQLMADLELQYRPIAQAKGLSLRIRPARGVVVSDRLLLQRILGNLVSNAIKYTERGGVLVGVRHEKGVPRVEVWDTGVGIAPANQRDIFREFYKIPIHAGTEDGFGLGLYIVSRLTAILGHSVSLSSRPGRGSVFRLLLTPADSAQAAARAESFADQLARRP
ncbi:sensor histidine kinase [Ramlibacter rhizophilus]|uniref:histidine kinase n=1 Tax=Ramlibacter rhizophilus TaxID=1781167 RepID=A0A4Z0BSD1_9BURK|nr:HAMP domain-containing sensor histidine kinase [Ramlibacter rhizophilus]TFZ01340.1 HAMP domain-containing histidine kinase [Ramlibacter rhizophilus]